MLSTNVQKGILRVSLDATEEPRGERNTQANASLRVRFDTHRYCSSSGCSFCLYSSFNSLMTALVSWSRPAIWTQTARFRRNPSERRVRPRKPAAAPVTQSPAWKRVADHL